MKKSNKKGFTLVELVVVIAIIGVLAAILVPSMLGYVKKSRLKTANANAKTAYNAISGMVTDANTQGTPINPVSLAGTDYNCKDGATITVTSSSSDEDKIKHELYKALGDNDKEAGIARIVHMTNSGANSQSYAIHWKKASGDDIIGQFPDPIPDVDTSVDWENFCNY